MSQRSYELLGLLSDWSTDDRHSFRWGFWLSDRSTHDHCMFGICARPRLSMWLLGLLSDWSTDGLSGFGWGYKLSDHSLMTWHVELRALTQLTYERRDKS